jgi:hypothetical protein
MKTISLLLLLFVQGAWISNPDMEFLRSNYGKAVSDKELCRSMINQLDKQTQGNVYLAYLGALQTIWAKHTGNPISKLSTFNKGKKNIEKAVKADPGNVEIRILRLSVQQNCPGFLGYDSNINEDTVFLKGKISTISPGALLTMAEQLLTKRTK